ncbi:glycosyltransferase family 9 protein [Pigmentiphaga sp. H8]|uniref:glycosyltransferase family 9 protein n=1 Tax=Pigmentiphaga sp. H8 TaxID=2488560 RepID=UPI000F5B63A4|nr:glycosyltransferase family 9 protein [Pigmentiphaga sp. H8]AZG07119.1 glycosyltransferase family 9 protein [Pigmentiphaga sp. H8]
MSALAQRPDDAPVTSGWDRATNILCVRLDNLGDVLMTTPALRALKHSAAGRRITLLCSPAGARLAPHLPSVDAAIAYDAPWVKNLRTADPAPDLAMIEQLRAGGFDAAAIFTVYSQSALPAALMCRLAGIPRVLAHARENPYQLLSDWTKDDVPMDGGRHETRRQLDLVASIGARPPAEGLEFAVRPADREAMRGKLAARGIADLASCIVVHPGASAPSRRYPPELFARVVRELSATAPVVLTGDAGERPLAEHVDVLAGRCATDMAGELSLGELGALLADAAVLVSNNSGPVHLAAAVGTPVADLYALTNPQHAPWGVEHRLLNRDVPCKYCYRSVCPEGHHACLAGVDPAVVVQAAHELLAWRRRACAATQAA